MLLAAPESSHFPGKLTLDQLSRSSETLAIGCHRGSRGRAGEHVLIIGCVPDRGFPRGNLPRFAGRRQTIVLRSERSAVCEFCRETMGVVASRSYNPGEKAIGSELRVIEEDYGRESPMW
jgi:hypothetical protein